MHPSLEKNRVLLDTMKKKPETTVQIPTLYTTYQGNSFLSQTLSTKITLVAGTIESDVIKKC